MEREKTFALPREAVEELDCSICMESKILCVLPCQHRLCNECIEQLAEHRRRITCPTCRRELVIPVEGFPVCRLTQYFREQLKDANSAQSQTEAKVTCQHCHKTVEAKCRDCQYFLCYRCVTKTKCSGNENHDAADLGDLVRSADIAIESWKKQAGDQLLQLQKQAKQMQKRVVDKQSIIKLFDMNAANESKLDRILFVEKLSTSGTPKEEDAVPENSGNQDEPSAQQRESREEAEILKDITMTGCLTSLACVSVCFSSKGDVIAGTFTGQLHVYKRSGELKSSVNTSGAIWSVCEDKGLIYAQCGQSTVEIFSYDLKTQLNTWSVRFEAGKIAALNSIIYITNSTEKTIIKFNFTGQNLGSVTHPSFAYPIHLKVYKKDSIVVCDTKADCIFMFKNGRCVWQIGLKACSGISVDKNNGNIWVKRLNKRTITVLSPEGDKLGCININGKTSSIKYDMAVDGNRLYLASDVGLLTSIEGSQMCSIS